MAMRTHYVLKNSAGQNLSGFYPNCGVRSKFLVYRENDWYTFPTRKEASDFLKYIREHGVGRSLSIRERVSLR